MLTAPRRAYVREVSKEVLGRWQVLHVTSRTGYQEVEFIALIPLDQSHGADPGTVLVVAGAIVHSQPHVPVGGAVAQLQHHLIAKGLLPDASIFSGTRCLEAMTQAH